uniref:Uncharacterized protein n=1 Tax=Anopheles coluzzii TaxID=1518534 RepID=A0A8W7PWB5_ANOCL
MPTWPIPTTVTLLPDEVIGSAIWRAARGSPGFAKDRIGERVECVGKRPFGPGFRHQKGFGSRRSNSAVVPGAASVNMCNRMCAYVQRLALLGFCIVAFSVFWWCFFCSIYVVMFGDALATYWIGSRSR